MEAVFTKYHALGNDYLVLQPGVTSETLTKKAIQLICHRHFGLGSDGILLPVAESNGADFGLRIFNPDGSEAEKSGNGLRIFARWLYDNGAVQDQPFSVHTVGGQVICRVLDQGRAATVAMGAVSFCSDKIPVVGGRREVLNEVLHVGGESLRYYAATIGNPHCVIPVEKVDAAQCRRLGPQIECHPNFPNRTNVQLLQVLSREAIQIEIWERGAGYTLASGSSSSAAAAVAYKMGVCDRQIAVHMPGGVIDIDIDPSFAVTMTGPVSRVGSMQLDPSVLEFFTLG